MSRTIISISPKDGDIPLVQVTWAGLGVVSLWQRGRGQASHPPIHIPLMSQRTPLKGPVSKGTSRQSTPVPIPAYHPVPMPASQTIQDMPVLKPASLCTKDVQLEEVEVQTTTLPIAMAWHQRKRAAAVATLSEAQASSKYTCTICGEPIASMRHSQFYGKWYCQYCPNVPGQVPKEERLAQ